MNIEIINNIKSKMMADLLPEQLEKLEAVLLEALVNGESSENNIKDNKNLIKQFISTKRIEGCSKRTEDYYFSTLSFFEKNIK